MAWCANAVESKVSGIDFDLLTAGNTLSIVAEDDGRYYWETAATEISSTIKALDEDDATKGNYLAVDETVPLYRTMNGSLNTVTPATGTSLAENGVYFKSDVQFTASDETSGAGMVAEGDKLLVWLRATEAVEADPEHDIEAVPATTNLIITAMNADGTGSADYVVANSGEGGINIDPATWYTLTIKAKQTGGVGEETAEFEVYVGDTKLASGQKTSFTSLVAAGGTTSTTITSVGFKGTGALDNLEFGTFTEVEQKFTFVLSVTDSDDVMGGSLPTIDGDEYVSPLTFDVGTESVVVFLPSVADPNTVTVTDVSGATKEYDSENLGVKVTIPTSTAKVGDTVSVSITISAGGEPPAANYQVTITPGANSTVTDITVNSESVGTTLAQAADGSVIVVTFTADEGYSFNGQSTSTKTATVSGAAVVITGDAATQSSQTTWPAAWTDSTGYAKDYATKLSAWATANNVADVSALSADDEDAFLLNVAPDAVKTLSVTTIVVEGGKVKITSNQNLKKVNGVTYILTGNEPNAVNTPAAATVDEEEGNIEYTPGQGETKKFYKIGVGYAVPTPAAQE